MSKIKPTVELMRKLAFIQKELAEYEERAQIVADLIEKTDYADELRHITREIEKLDERAAEIKRTITTRVLADTITVGEAEVRPGVLLSRRTTSALVFAKDLSVYLEDGPHLMKGEG